MDALKDLGHDVKDFGNITQDRVGSISPQNKGVGPKRPQEVGVFNEKLSELVQQVKEDGRIVLTLGGDHSIALGTLHGHLKHYEGSEKTPCVLWVDAHADINTTSGSMSGNMHGMPLSFNVKEMHNENENLENMAWFAPR